MNPSTRLALVGLLALIAFFAGGVAGGWLLAIALSLVPALIFGVLYVRLRRLLRADK